MDCTEMIVFFTMLFPSVLPALTTESAPSSPCTGTLNHDGHQIFRLSQPPMNPSCETSWEDVNRNVIARDNEFNGALVANLTDWSIALLHCHDYLRYTMDCYPHATKNVDCTANCTALQVQRAPPSPEPEPENISSWWVWLVVALVLLVLLVFGAVIIYCVKKRKKQTRLQWLRPFNWMHFLDPCYHHGGQGSLTPECDL